MSQDKSITITKTVGQTSISYYIKNYSSDDAAFLSYFLSLDKEDQEELLDNTIGSLELAP